MVNVAVNVLTVTVDPDIGALSIGGRCGQSDLTMVIEVIRAFPMVDARPTLPTSPHGDEVPGSRLIGELEFQGKWFEPQAFREVVIRAASRMDTSQPPTKMGALVSKQAVFVLFLTREEIMLSTPMEYTGLRPHPASALAHSFNVAVEDPRLENLSIFCGSVSLSRQ
ncbi:hypothetical protein IWQ57_003164 [Coemansia nantahalensis]|uniref:Uncharacterized protein n=1 Tax=Coemansia nantahalensis TaxID=2789366 RepID=A0ACC1JXY7_9FUNG|nr:hypothetical protein IWQ57_003164 [Coemansia nantahalensis]